MFALIGMRDALDLAQEKGLIFVEWLLISPRALILQSLNEDNNITPIGSSWGVETLSLKHAVYGSYKRYLAF